jgi:hypothetical protein
MSTRAREVMLCKCCAEAFVTLVKKQAVSLKAEHRYPDDRRDIDL